MARKLKIAALYRTYATPSDVVIVVSNLVNSAPTALYTFNESATALSNDAVFSTISWVIKVE